MKIAVNTRLLIPNKLEGISWFTFETLKRITHQHEEHKFYFIFDRPFSKEFIFSENVFPTYIGPQTRHPFLYLAWFEFALPSVLNKIKPDLFLSPDGYLSLKTDCRSLPVIHDLNFEHNPQDLPFLFRHYYKTMFPRFAHKAHRIATVSEYSKQDIVNLYGVNPDKIDVVYNGANSTYTPLTDLEKKATLEKYTFGKPYFVFVGALHPRKNIANLFKAFDSFKRSKPSEYKLVIVGEKKWWTSEMQDTYENLIFKKDVVFTGRLYNKELNQVVGAAAALTYVSIFEGFGIPILEAFYCDVPVITSNLTSMPEVAGDAALFVDPYSVESIAQAMLTIATDEKVRQDLILKGRERRKEFSWKKTSERLWASIEKAME